jgi:hypothetical protein
MRNPIPFAALALALFAGQARADTIDVTSTTMLQLGEQTRGGAALSEPELVTIAPLFEILTIAAHDVTNPVADDLALVVSTWGAYELQDMRWDNGTSSDLHGDVVTMYAQGKLLDRRLTLRLGREHVMTGAARMIHLDGGEAIVRLPAGVRLSAYGGVPVSQRFASRGTLQSWNPSGGDVAFGGRAAWSLAFAGYPGRGLDVGASANFVQDGDESVREEVAVDARLQPLTDDLTFTALAAYSLYDERFSEVAGRASWSVTPQLRVEADGRFFAPDLFLARNSILAVFASERRTSWGGGLGYDLGKGLAVGASYHLAIEPGETEASDDDDYFGHEAEASLEWHKGPTLAGAELLYLDALENGYVALRLFGRRDLGRFFATADVFSHLFRESVNGEDLAVSGTLAAGVDIARGFSAVVSGRAGLNPFLEQTFDVMAKLAYNSTYRIREVR